MRKIILTSLFFCLAITTILAQVVTTNIATPNSSGLSNNQVVSFDVNSDGTILNNSATGGTAQLGNTGVAANNNITAGSEAELILFQVNGTSGSGLNGTIEVFGGEAGLIIANPNGIVCDGCGFINADRVDLVTGSGYDLDTNTFSTIAATDITVEGSALELSNVDLNIQTGRDFINSTTIDAENLNVIAAGDFLNQSSSTISADTVTIEVTNFDANIYNTGTISADSLNFILTDSFTRSSTSFSGFTNFNNLGIITDSYFANEADLTVNNFNVTAGGNFVNYETINANDFNVTAGDSFYNWYGATIDAENFNVTAGDLFYNYRGAIINADSFNVTAGDRFYNYRSATINADSFNVTAGGHFYNYRSATINADSFNVTAGGHFYNYRGAIINADSFNVTAGGHFYNYRSATINANDFNVTAGADFINSARDFENNNNSTINADSFNVTADSFLNEANSTITANECNIIYTTSYTDNGTITCNDEDEIEVIDIARPDANGLSNNSYTDFNILNSGIVLNNSDSAGTSQLAGDISANTNYNSGDAASLILAQITGNDISLLEGALEVFGAEAGVIIANPSGITCNGCSFINACSISTVILCVCEIC